MFIRIYHARPKLVKTLRSEQNNLYFADGTFKCISLTKSIFWLNSHWSLLQGSELQHFSGNVLVPSSSKPLLESIFNIIYVAIWFHYAPMNGWNGQDIGAIRKIATPFWFIWCWYVSNGYCLRAPIALPVFNTDERLMDLAYGTLQSHF